MFYFLVSICSCERDGTSSCSLQVHSFCFLDFVRCLRTGPTFHHPIPDPQYRHQSLYSFFRLNYHRMAFFLQMGITFMKCFLLVRILSDLGIDNIRNMSYKNDLKRKSIGLLKIAMGNECPVLKHPWIFFFSIQGMKMKNILLNNLKFELLKYMFLIHS